MRGVAPLLAAALIFLSACATGVVPQTGTERYIAADGAYKALLLTVKDGVVRGTIKGQAAADIRIALTSIKVALDVWALVPNDPNAEAVAIAALAAAQSILRAVGPQTKYEEWIVPGGGGGSGGYRPIGGHRDGMHDLKDTILREYAI